MIANCICYDSNTPELEKHCPCNGIDNRTEEERTREAEICSAISSINPADIEADDLADACLQDMNELYRGKKF